MLALPFLLLVKLANLNSFPPQLLREIIYKPTILVLWLVILVQHLALHMATGENLCNQKLEYTPVTIILPRSLQTKPVPPDQPLIQNLATPLIIARVRHISSVLLQLALLILIATSKQTNITLCPLVLIIEWLKV